MLFNARKFDYLPYQEAVCISDACCCEVAYNSSCRGFTTNNYQNIKISKMDYPFITSHLALIGCCEKTILVLTIKKRTKNCNEGMIAKVNR